jgi:chromosome segregation protein
MRLKRLEMVGFKSFADKTRIEFEPGITAVVGPNGCGKSNISDAIRWALGEMSARSLRSQQMLDVIFNGTASRAAQGMSEVSLTFDNTSHQIPLDYTEITIARRLFRSGESEYYINKTQCRLKDVRDLFLDTGVGNDGYYMMAQGKIEFLLSAKPEERRELFEEAAGVSKYKVRREEALRKLAKVEQDMLRLNDSLAIYKQQMDALETAVRKARQHQKLQDDLKKLEIASLVHGYRKAQTDWDQIHLRQEEEARRLGELREDVAVREKTLAEARLGSESLEEGVIDLQRKIVQYESDWAKAEAERIGAQEREMELKAAHVRLGQEAEQLEKLMAEWHQTLSGLEGEVQALRIQFHEKHEAYKQEEEKGRHEQAELLNLQKNLEQSKARLLELARLISHHRNETVRLTSLTVRHEEASKAKEREIEKISLRRGALEEQAALQEKQSVDTQEKLVTIQNTLRAIDDLQRRDRMALAELERSIQSGRERLARLEAEQISLERWLSQDPVALAAGALRQASLPGIHGPVSLLLRTSGPYQRLLDRALGDRAHYFVADSLNDAQSAIRFLSDERKGWATFLVLDRLTQEEHLLPFSETMGTRSLAEAVECEEKFRPVLNLLLGRTFYVGETLFEEGLLRGGADPATESYQATPGDLGRLVQELTELRQTLDAGAVERTRLETAIAEREAERQPIAEDHNKIHVLSQVQQESLSRLHEDLRMNETEAKLLVQEKKEALWAIHQTQEALQQEEILLTTLEEEEKTLQDSFQAQDATLQEKRQTVQSHLAQISQLRLEAETMRERLLGKERDMENAQSRLDAFEDRSKQIQSEVLDTTHRLEQLAQVQIEKAQLLKGLQSTREEQNTKLSDLLMQRQELQSCLHGQEEDVAACRDKLTRAQAEAQEAEFVARTLDQERTRIEQTLLNTWQLSIEDARASHGDVTPDAEELARVKRRLEGMGAVNLAAPEEHAQLEERYKFLLTQQQDLLKAKDDLHQAISKINATTREQFKNTFEQVRTNFRSLFQTLFQGGESDLVLTDEQNLLETGIEIFAQPPGKKLQNITLLSGGEKALTAIAVLFAFFMVKPSPFCLLDEVDAPLDEANVGRFIRMVQQFAEKTQFIVITHNKRTMEVADVIYGVTMAQLGVSSLISMKLEATSKTPEPVAA